MPYNDQMGGREKPIPTVFPTPGHDMPRVDSERVVECELLKVVYETPPSTEVECTIEWLYTIDSL